MTAGAWVAIGVIVAATLTTTVKFRHKTMLGLVVIPLYGFLIAIAVVYYVQRDATQAQVNHTNCVNRHEGRANDRQMWFKLTDRLAARGLPSDAAYLRMAVDDLKPDISKEKCP